MNILQECHILFEIVSHCGGNIARNLEGILFSRTL